MSSKFTGRTETKNRVAHGRREAAKHQTESIQRFDFVDGDCDSVEMDSPSPSKHNHPSLDLFSEAGTPKSGNRYTIPT